VNRFQFVADHQQRYPPLLDRSGACGAGRLFPKPPAPHINGGIRDVPSRRVRSR
jgi:hypothetical protein